MLIFMPFGPCVLEAKHVEFLEMDRDLGISYVLMLLSRVRYVVLEQ